MSAEWYWVGIFRISCVSSAYKLPSAPDLERESSHIHQTLDLPENLLLGLVNILLAADNLSESEYDANKNRDD